MGIDPSHAIQKSWHRVSAGLVLSGSVWLVACAQAPGPQGVTRDAAVVADAASAKVAAPATARLTFVDLDSFDKQVEQALASGAPAIEIELIAGMSPNQIAPRLGRWLNTVQETGGDLKVTGAPRTRSLGLLATLGEAAFKAWNEQRLRSLVKGVNAELAINGERIDKVTLRRP